MTAGVVGPAKNRRRKKKSPPTFFLYLYLPTDNNRTTCGCIYCRRCGYGLDRKCECRCSHAEVEWSKVPTKINDECGEDYLELHYVAKLFNEKLEHGYLYEIEIAGYHQRRGWGTIHYDIDSKELLTVDGEFFKEVCGAKEVPWLKVIKDTRLINGKLIYKFRNSRVWEMT